MKAAAGERRKENRGGEGADLEEVNLEWTLRVGGIEPDQLLYILESEISLKAN